MTTTELIRPTPYRTAEGETIDIEDADTQQWMAARYPAIINPRPAGMSDGYQFMDPRHLIRTANAAGLHLVQVGQQWSRSRDPRGQEHVLRFRFPNRGEFALKRVGDSIPELVIMNSHNGRSCIRAYAGLFRLVCSNGMVIADEDFGSAVMRHFGKNNTLEAFLGLMNAMVRKMAVLRSRVEAMQATMLSAHKQNQLARAMMEMRGTPKWVEPAMVLEARRKADEREEDGQRSLWVTYNVLQENLTNAEIKAPEGSQGRAMRPVHGAMRDLAVNQKLWDVLDGFAQKWVDPKLLPKPDEGDAEGAAEEASEAQPAEETPAERKRRKQRERYHARKQAQKAEQA